MIRKVSLKAAAASGLCLALFVVIAVAQEILPEGGKPKPIKKIVKLQASAVEPKASGIAKINFKTQGNAQQKFQVMAANLRPGTTYRLFVDGMEIASSTASSADMGSSVEFMFSKKTTGGVVKSTLPATLDPVTLIKLVELRDPSNMIVLSGVFPQ